MRSKSFEKVILFSIILAHSCTSYRLVTPHPFMGAICRYNGIYLYLLMLLLGECMCVCENRIHFDSFSGFIFNEIHTQRVIMQRQNKVFYLNKDSKFLFLESVWERKTQKTPSQINKQQKKKKNTMIHRVLPVCFVSNKSITRNQSYGSCSFFSSCSKKKKFCLCKTFTIATLHIANDRYISKAISISQRIWLFALSYRDAFQNEKFPAWVNNSVVYFVSHSFVFCFVYLFICLFVHSFHLALELLRNTHTHTQRNVCKCKCKCVYMCALHK